ncbi:MAG: GMP synthase [Pseudomonadota bacterium]
MPAFDCTTASIAAWNLAGFQTIDDERVERQIEGLAIIDAHVVTLVEVKPLSHMQRLVDGLAAKGCTYKSVILPQASDLNIGVLYKEGVIAGTPEFIPNSDLGNPARRKAFAVDMKIGKFDFHLIVVHLKSGRGAAEQAERDEQCKVIGGYITARTNDPDNQIRREDILLMGDFNMIPGEDVSNFHHLGGDDIMNFVSSWDLQERFSHILPKGRANLLDGFAITRKRSTEYIKGSLRLFPMHWTMDMGRETYRNEVSDHLPFIASFRIDRSRD